MSAGEGFMYIFILVGVAVLAFAIGQSREGRRWAERVASLREALADTQKALNAEHTLKAEAVAAQEQAEAALKAAFARKSEAGKRAWVTRKANEEGERVKRIFFGDPDATDAPTSTMVVSDAGAVDPIVKVSDAA